MAWESLYKDIRKTSILLQGKKQYQRDTQQQIDYRCQYVPWIQLSHWNHYLRLSEFCSSLIRFPISF